MIRKTVSDVYATVGAREDIDGAELLVVFCPNRSVEYEDDLIELSMDARTARVLARRLNRWARMVSS